MTDDNDTTTPQPLQRTRPTTDREALAACAAAIPKLTRCLFPVELVDAQQATTGEPYGDDDCALQFMGSGGSDRVTFGEVRAALQAAGDALDVCEQQLQQSVDDVTWWMTVADGVTHDPRCSPPELPCLRCRLDLSMLRNDEAARLVLEGQRLLHNGDALLQTAQTMLQSAEQERDELREQLRRAAVRERWTFRQLRRAVNERDALREQLQRTAGRVVPPDWHGPAEDF